MESHELMLAVGRVLRDAARKDGAPDEFGRSQLLSAYSVARHLAAEQAAHAELLTWLSAALVAELAGDGRAAMAEASRRIGAARTGPQVGAATAEALDALGEDETALRGRLRRVLAEMADREVDVLAAAL
jgi:hypothetical protein